MSTVIERLREAVIGPALLDGRVSDGALAERLIRERHEAADRLEALEAALGEAVRLLTISYFAGLKLGFSRQEPDASLPHEVREFVAEFHGENGGPLHVAARTAKTLLQKSK